MSIYLLDRNNRIPSIKAALQAAGVVTTVHFENTTDLIVTTTRSNKVLRIRNDGSVWIGSAWTSGATITNSQTLLGSISMDPYDWAIIVTPDILAFCCKNGTGNTGDCYSAIFTKTEDLSLFLAIGLSSSNSTNNNDSYCYDTTITASQATILSPISFSGIVTDAAGYYYFTDIYLKTLSNNVLITSPAKGIKAILNGYMNTQGFYKYGNDIVSQGWYTNDGGTSFFANVLIPNGNI